MTRARVRVVAACIALCTAGTTASCAAPNSAAFAPVLSARNGPLHGSLLFEESFRSPSLNSAYWNPFVTDNAAGGWPWNHQRGQPKESSAVDRPGGFYDDYDVPGAIRTGEGLVLVARAGTTAKGFSWTSAAISSYPDDRFTRTGGVTVKNALVEVRARLPYTGNGMWPAIWFLAAPGSHGPEIDLHEGGFRDGSLDPDRIFACHLYGHGNVQHLVDTGERLSTRYHTFAMSYRAGRSIEMFLDGRRMCAFRRGVPTGRYFLILNNGVASTGTASWHSQVNALTGWHSAMRVAWIKIVALGKSAFR